MSWADTVKANALAALAERTTTAAQKATDTPWRWDAHDIWLARVRQPRDGAIQSSRTDSTTTPRPDIAARR